MGPQRAVVGASIDRRAQTLMAASLNRTITRLAAPLLSREVHGSGMGGGAGRWAWGLRRSVSGVGVWGGGSRNDGPSVRVRTRHLNVCKKNPTGPDFWESEAWGWDCQLFRFFNQTEIIGASFFPFIFSVSSHKTKPKKDDHRLGFFPWGISFLIPIFNSSIPDSFSSPVDSRRGGGVCARPQEGDP